MKSVLVKVFCVGDIRGISGKYCVEAANPEFPSSKYNKGAIVNVYSMQEACIYSSDDRRLTQCYTAHLRTHISLVQTETGFVSFSLVSQLVLKTNPGRIKGS